MTNAAKRCIIETDNSEEKNVEKYFKIAGWQALTLLDYPEHTACTVFCGGCNFKCPYCHNSEIIGGLCEYFDEEEIFSHIEKHRRMLDAVCISGGEPTVNSDLDRIMRRVKDMGLLVKLDTNGFRPDVIEKLLGEKLVDYIAMDIKNSLDRYAETTGLSPSTDFSPIKRSIEIIMSSGVGYEFRTTVAAETFDDESMDGAARLVAGADKYYLQRFAMRPTVADKSLHAPDDATMTRYLEICRRHVPNAEIRGE